MHGWLWLQPGDAVPAPVGDGSSGAPHRSFEPQKVRALRRARFIVGLLVGLPAVGGVMTIASMFF